MKVNELIEQLKNMPQDATVYIAAVCGNCGPYGYGASDDVAIEYDNEKNEVGIVEKK